MNQNKSKQSNANHSDQAARKANICHVSKFLDFNVSRTNCDVVSKQRYDGFPSVGDHIHAATTF